MISSRFDPRQFFQRVENVALRVPGEELFGLLRRSLDLPGGWGAMVTRGSGMAEVIRAGGVIDGSNADDVLLIRCTPIEVTLAEDGFVSADAFACRAEVRLQISVIPDRNELVCFTRGVLGSHRVVQIEGIARFLRPALRAALESFVSARSAESLLDVAISEEAADVVAAALDGPLFSGGLTVESNPVVRFDSDAARSVRQSKEKAARAMAEHEASSDLRRAIEQAQQSHLAHVTEVLAQLNDLATTSPQATLGELIRTFPETQRGELYGVLFSAELTRAATQWLVIAAGDELLWFDPVQFEQPARTMKITSAAGRVRSIQALRDATGSSAIWLGAERGLYKLSIEQGSIERAFPVSDADDVHGGFNSVAFADGYVFGAHSELGIRRWSIDSEEPGETCLGGVTSGARTIRHIQVHGDRLYCAIDNAVITWSPEREDEVMVTYAGSTSAITSLLVVDKGIFAGNAAGDVLYWPYDRYDKPERMHASAQRAVESVWLLETHGLQRLFFADTSPRIHARVIGDNFTRFYEAGGQTLRRVEVSQDLVAATNELRDRVFVWTTGSPGPARGVIPVGSLSGRSIQDVCLTPRT